MKKDNNISCSINNTQNYFVDVNCSYKVNHTYITENQNGPLSSIEKFVEDYYFDIVQDYPNTNRNDKKLALNNILTNLMFAYESGKTIAIPRNKAAYKYYAFYGLSHFTYTNIITCLDGLVKNGFIRQRKGYFDRELKSGKITRIWPKEKLLCKIKPYVIEIPIQNQFLTKNYSNILPILYKNFTGLKKLKYKPPIILKDRNKNPIPFKMDIRTKRMKKFLEHYNHFIEQNNIQISLTDFLQTYPSFNSYFQTNTSIGSTISYIPLLGQSEAKSFSYLDLDAQLTRVFNNMSFDEGGRFYRAGYQALNEEMRSKILINESETIELDYSALHPRMIYHLEDIDYSNDPYAIIGVEQLRKPIKKMFQMMINAKSVYQTVVAFEKYLDKEPAIKNIIYEKGLDGWELVKIIKSYHKKIKKYFNSGMGVKLQYTDSKIAEAILKHFTLKGIVCLCIHDSFIVPAQYADELYRVMIKEYKKEMGFEPQIKNKIKE